MKLFNSFLALCALACCSFASFAQSGTPELITTPPQGETIDYSKSCTSYHLVGYDMVLTESAGTECKVVYCDNNEVYLSSPFNSVTVPGWLKGEKIGDELVFPLPQVVDRDDFVLPDGSTYISLSYAAIGEIINKDQYGDDIYGVRAQNNELRLAINGDKLTYEGSQQAPLCIFDNQKDYRYCAEWNIVCTVFHGASVTLPEGAEAQPYEIISGGDAYNAEMAFVGNDVYLGKFSQFAPDAWVKGTLEDGKVIFPSGQYMGYYEPYNRYVYFVGVQRKYINENDYDFERIDNLVFDYDATTGTLTTDNGFVVNTNSDVIHLYQIFELPTLRKPNTGEPQSYIPQNPKILHFYDTDPIFIEDGSLIFEMPRLSVNDDILPTTNLYYRIFVNDDSEPWVFSPEDYTHLTADLIDVPYGYTDEYDFICSGTYHKVFFKFHGADKIGVQSVYQGSGDDYLSDIVWVENSGVETIDVDIENGVSTYYDLNGLRVNNPQKGLYIVRTTGENGKVAVKKVLRK